MFIMRGGKVRGPSGRAPGRTRTHLWAPWGGESVEIGRVQQIELGPHWGRECTGNDRK